MAFADASEAQVSFVQESVFGTTPATPTWQRMRVTSEDLTGEQDTRISNELRPDAEVADLILVGLSATGSLPFELSFGPDFDVLFEHALRGTFSGNDLAAAVEKKSMTLEKIFQGTAANYFRYRGCRVGQLDLTFQASEIVTGTINFLGLDEALDTAQIPSSTYDPPNGNPVMAAPDVGTITVGGVTGQMFYTEMSMSLNNNLRAQNALGSIGAVGIGYGRREVTGNITAYFENVDLYEEAVNNTISSISLPVSDGTNTYTFTLPKVKFATRRAVAGGNNQDILAELTYQALVDTAVENTSVKIVKS